MQPSPNLIELLCLQPHPEGGWYREVHRSSELLQTARGPRSALTAIHFLLQRPQFSRWHVVESDEIWHYACGAPLELLIYRPDAREFRRQVLGPPDGERTATGIVRAGEWQAARSLGDQTLVGCDVAPGFDFEDFRLVATLEGHEAHFTGELAAWSSLL